MSKSTLNKILAKLDLLNEYLGHLKEIQNVNQADFIRDYHFYGLAERYFQLSIETMLDIAKLIIVDQNLKRPSNHQAVFTILTEAKIIPQKLVTQLEWIVGFRNILVHEYETINRKKVYARLQNNLDQFHDFKKAIARFLKKYL